MIFQSFHSRKFHRKKRMTASSERGHLLITLVIAIAVSMILLTVATRAWTSVIQRDKEEELIFRGQEYGRALVKFKKAMGRLPVDLKELVERGPRNERFIRKLYTDPMTPDGKWNLLYLSPDGRTLINPHLAPPALEEGLTGFGGGRGRRSRNQSRGSQRMPVGKIAGLQIAGIVSKSEEKAFKIYRQKEYYNEWEFSIFDVLPVETGKKRPTPPRLRRPGVF
jgi:type II secretory pathway pseudopilin PulG